MKKLLHPIVSSLTAIVLISPTLLHSQAKATPANSSNAEAGSEASTSAPPKTPPKDAEYHASGLVTQRLVEGRESSGRPDANDYVSVHYELWTPDGKKFQSSYAADKPGEFLLERIAPAWSEAVQMMTQYEKRRLWIPAELTPKNRKKQGPQGAVICDIELRWFRRLPNLPAKGVTPPPGTGSNSFGVYTLNLEKGVGKEKGETGIGVLANFTLWTQNGKIHDSTIIRDRPTFFPFDRVMPAFGSTLKEMVEGEKARLWIPANIANGNWVGGPKGMLIFDVEVIKIMDEGVLAPPQSGKTDLTVGGPKKSG